MRGGEVRRATGRGGWEFTWVEDGRVDLCDTKSKAALLYAGRDRGEVYLGWEGGG